MSTATLERPSLLFPGGRPAAARAGKVTGGETTAAGSGDSARAGCTARRHGDYSAYCQGCRCPDAREDWRIYSKRRRQGRATPRVVDGLGTQRRMRALVALGWRTADLGDQLGVTQRAAQRLCHAPRVTLRTRGKVAALYDHLSMTPGPSQETARRAAANDWHPPLAWADEDLDNPSARPAPRTAPAKKRHAPDPVAVARALAGEQLPLWPADKVEVARRIVAAGGGANQVAQVLHMNGSYARRLVERVAS